MKVILILLLSCVHFAASNAGFEADGDLTVSNGTEPIPVVLWHGMGDICCNPLSMGSIKRQIERKVPGIYVYSIMVGDNIIEDFLNGFIMNVNEQVAQICEKIQNDSRLANGYHGMGFSQGGQFLRAVAQRCPSPPMRNLITFGGQHQGVYGVPHCNPDNFTVCEYVREAATAVLYDPKVQKFSTQAEYWHDSNNPIIYDELNVFLADINNELKVNEDYKTNLLKLWNFVMVQFTEDTMVIPKESEWFAFYENGQDEVILPLENSTLYTEDKLGLKTLDEQGRLVRYPIAGDHLQITRSELDDIIDKYVIPTSPN